MAPSVTTARARVSKASNLLALFRAAAFLAFPLFDIVRRWVTDPIASGVRSDDGLGGPLDGRARPPRERASLKPHSLVGGVLSPLVAPGTLGCNSPPAPPNP